MRSRPHRRPSRALAALTMGALTLASIPTSAVAQGDAPSAPTQGQALAEMIRIDPAIASLALTVSIGTAIAGHQNTGSGSQTSSIDFGIIGDLLTGEGCDGGDPTIPRESLPEGLLIDSSDPASAEGVSGGIDGLVDLHAQADNSPASRSTATLTPIGVPGLLEIEGGRTISTSNGTTATATAVTEIGKIALVDGLVNLRGLRWEATRSLSGAGDMATAFTIGAIEIAGTPVALPEGIDAIADLLAPVLSVLGFELSMPKPFEVPGGIGLSALTFGIIPADARDSVVGGLLSALQPARASLQEQLLAMDCSNATYLTVLDVVLGSVSGGGSLTVDLGGVQAAVSEVTLTSFLGGDTGALGDAPGPIDAPPAVPSGNLADAAPSGTSSLPSVAPSPPVVDNGPTESAAAVIDVPDPLEGERGGALLYVGLLGLVGIGLAGALERHKMRKGQRSGPMPGV